VQVKGVKMDKELYTPGRIPYNDLGICDDSVGIWRDNKCIGMLFFEEDVPAILAALNAGVSAAQKIEVSND
jgi:hypothetical protein